jgi:hypothetical protein
VALGDSAPLIVVAHDWTSPVERVREYPTAVMVAEDGTEQRQALSHLPTDTITYRILAPSMAEALAVRAAVDLADDHIVRIPRWEDQTRVDTAASAGSAVTVSCDTTDRPTFVVGAQVILWRGPGEYEVATLDGVTDTDITVDLADDWAAGTIVAPITAARLVEPLTLTHWGSTSGALDLVVECTLADLAGVGTGGSGAAGTPAAIVIVADVTVLSCGREPIAARVTDAAGNVLTGQAIVWTSSDAVNAPVSPTSDPHVAIVGNPTPVFIATATITATLGALSDTASANLNPFS